MANIGEQYGSQTDAYANPALSQADEYGRTGTGGLGGGPHFSTDINTHGQQQHRRTGSNSSSSSEDDGEGGRRKKKIGITEKIKEKLKGEQTMDQDQDQQASTTCTPAAGSGREGSYEGAEEGEQPEADHEKKGMMDMIKDELPGGSHH